MDEHDRTKMCIEHDKALSKVETEVVSLMADKDAIVARLQLLVDQYHAQNVLFERLSGDIRALSLEVKSLGQQLRDDGVTQIEFRALKRIVFWAVGLGTTVGGGLILKLFKVV